MMRKLILAAVAAAIAGAPLASVSKAEGTTTTQKSDTMGPHKTKKYQNRATPRESQKMMMHHNQNY
jgi:Ni/Co efflux regulator RcnB